MIPIRKEAHGAHNLVLLSGNADVAWATMCARGWLYQKGSLRSVSLSKSSSPSRLKQRVNTSQLNRVLCISDLQSTSGHPGVAQPSGQVSGLFGL
eukprot:CAMPEP_0174738438 /NCGR_PEP_ID=MMETSP1094-20130205/69950_1 /TAXON_ID=156173 /ORGANISM="Chrysochromulina brevifilum, Strain UTEX LB 985" /LENGTH=94 /DNA_ID=CAMNT_0015941847 /DNA_START=22 /DNA_END=310 /DNA_ORIENTATION=-